MGSLHYRFYAGAIAYLLAARIGLVSVLGHDDEGLSHDHPLFEFQLSNAVLPKPLSDMTATLYGGIVYLAGGCDAPNGNVYNAAIGEFTCDSASDALYAFHYRKNTVEVLATLPRPRYRHAAVAVNDRLWLVGGRTTEDDSIIGQVDVSVALGVPEWNVKAMSYEGIRIGICRGHSGSQAAAQCWHLLT
jgi:hypothetical protein